MMRFVKKSLKVRIYPSMMQMSQFVEVSVLEEL